MAANLPDPTGTSPAKPNSTVGTRIRNLIIVVVAIALSVAVFFGLQTQTSSVSLNSLAEEATPLEVALKNGKPTLMEFYANWCTSCQAMAPEIDALEQQYQDKINFVMLNVDNTKWLPEVLHYRVDGIPHFVFLNQNGEAIANAIGEQPRTIMAANLEALVAGTSLPYAQATGQVSAFSTAVKPTKPAIDDPRSHSSQVVN
ncbi:MAG TPA: thioredoxin family protein [Allocoleopsis sp.]